MACPHKKQDAEIIAEVAKRKAIKENNVVPEYTYEYLTFEGDLQNILMFAIDQKDIVTITNEGDRRWNVMYRKRTEL